MALQPRALASDSTPNPLPPTGEVEAGRRRGRNTTANLGLALLQTSSGKDPKFQPEQARRQWLLGSSTTKPPFPDLKTCWQQGSPELPTVLLQGAYLDDVQP